MKFSKQKSISKKGTQDYIREFDSLSDFEKYIKETPLNDVFRWTNLDSVDGSKYFTKTESYEEAVKLFENGWDDMAQDLTKQIKIRESKQVNEYANKILYDVVGFQASVPRYLQGIPTAMVNKKQIPVKRKVITLNKDISYNAGIKADQIIEASIQTLQLIKKIEAQGIRVNLNLIWGDSAGEVTELVKIRLKSANERLNISKLAFPLVHPSMLRRLLFRFIEVTPEITHSFKPGYGVPLNGEQLKKYCKDEYLLPRLFDGNLADLGDLQAICSLSEKIVVGKKNPKI